MERIDLSHTIEHGTVTYPGLPAALICDFLSREDSKKHYSEGTQFQIGKLEMVANTGTYLDAPFHRYATAKDIAALSLNKLVGLEAICVDVSAVCRAQGDHVAIDAEYFKDLDCQDRAVLVRTDWSRHWGTDKYFSGHPFLTADAAEILVDAGAVLVGIDSLNIDDNRGGERPVHTRLLGVEILIVEHMCQLEKLPARNFKFTAVPPRIRGMGTFPVRAFAEISAEKG